MTAAKGEGRHMKEWGVIYYTMYGAVQHFAPNLYGRLYRKFCESPKSGVVNDVTHQSEHQQCQGETSDGKREREDNYTTIRGSAELYPCPVISEIHGIPSEPPIQKTFQNKLL